MRSHFASAASGFRSAQLANYSFLPVHRGSGGAQVLCRGLAGLAIGNNLERDFLSLVEAVHPGAFDRADVDKNVLAAIIRLDEAEALLAVKPFHGSFASCNPLSVLRV